MDYLTLGLVMIAAVIVGYFVYRLKASDARDARMEAKPEKKDDANG